MAQEIRTQEDLGTTMLDNGNSFVGQIHEFADKFPPSNRAHEDLGTIEKGEVSQPQDTIHTTKDLITFEEKPITPISSWEKTEERKKFIDEDAEEIQAITRKIEKLKAQSKKAYKFDGHYTEHPALYKNPYHFELETV
jgi:hypothetical protein